MCTEHARLVERLRSEKDEEMNSRLQQLEEQTAKRIEILQKQHADTINTLHAGNCALSFLMPIHTADADATQLSS